DIGRRRALYGEDDGGRLVIPGGKLIIGGTDRSPADIADADRRTVAIGDDRFVIGRQPGQLVIGLQGVGLRRPFQYALRIIDGDVGECRADIFERQAERRELRRVDLHAHGRLLLPADGDEPDTWHLREFLLENALAVIIDRGQRQGCGGERQQQNWRIGG